MKKRCRIFYARGFTMIELLVSITLLAFAMGLTFYNFSFLYSSIVRSEIETLHATCMYLQRKAMATNQEQQISFNISDNSYSFGGTVYHGPAGQHKCAIIRATCDEPFCGCKMPVGTGDDQRCGAILIQ